MDKHTLELIDLNLDELTSAIKVALDTIPAPETRTRVITEHVVGAVRLFFEGALITPSDMATIYGHDEDGLDEAIVAENAITVPGSTVEGWVVCMEIMNPDEGAPRGYRTITSVDLTPAHAIGLLALASDMTRNGYAE